MRNPTCDVVTGGDSFVIGWRHPSSATIRTGNIKFIHAIGSPNTSPLPYLSMYVWISAFTITFDAR